MRQQAPDHMERVLEVGAQDIPEGESAISEIRLSVRLLHLGCAVGVAQE